MSPHEIILQRRAASPLKRPSRDCRRFREGSSRDSNATRTLVRPSTFYVFAIHIKCMAARNGEFLLPSEISGWRLRDIRAIIAHPHSTLALFVCSFRSAVPVRSRASIITRFASCAIRKIFNAPLRHYGRFHRNQIRKLKFKTHDTTQVCAFNTGERHAV